MVISAHSVLGMVVSKVWENNSHLLKKKKEKIAGPEENPNDLFLFFFPLPVSFHRFRAAESARGRFVECLDR